MSTYPSAWIFSASFVGGLCARGGPVGGVARRGGVIASVVMVSDDGIGGSWSDGPCEIAVVGISWRWKLEEPQESPCLVKKAQRQNSDAGDTTSPCATEPHLHVCAPAWLAAFLGSRPPGTITAMLELPVLITACGSPEGLDNAAATAAATSLWMISRTALSEGRRGLGGQRE